MNSEMFDANAFSGYRVLITGSSRGIGHDVAMALRRLGADIAVHGTNAPDAKRDMAPALAPWSHWPVISARTGWPPPLLTRQPNNFGGLDCLINNAGTMMGRNPIVNLPTQLYQQIVDLNATSLVEASIAAIPALSESPAPQSSTRHLSRPEPEGRLDQAYTAVPRPLSRPSPDRARVNWRRAGSVSTRSRQAQS